MDLKKPTINLSLFTTLTESFSIEKPNKSPRSFENSVVGLSIVAAMNDLDTVKAQESVKVSNFTLCSQKSSPIPIVSSAKVAMNFRGCGGSRIMDIDRERSGYDVVNESDESYTCVISHVGNNEIRKHVYYGDQFGGFCDDDAVCVVDINPGLFYASSSPIVMTISDGCMKRNGFWTQDFLSSCYLCNKMLHGLDIFMYRGEKAFCSTDCRDKQIRSDNYKEKCGSEARKQQHEYSISPRSSPQACFAGVAAA